MYSFQYIKIPKVYTIKQTGTGKVYSFQDAKILKVCSSRRVIVNEVSRATKGITNSTTVLKATMVSEASVATMWSKINGATIQGHCNKVRKKRQT
jgi:hypothetical protein